ncbi:MAG: BREX protein BrxB domain-containing protein [Candidatus Paceibacterota bacterium]
MSNENLSLKEFKTKLKDFATGKRRGIRNPFVILPVRPAIEYQVFGKMKEWSPSGECSCSFYNLEKLFIKTRAIRITNAYLNDASPKRLNPEEIEKNIGYTLPREIAEQFEKDLLSPGSRRQILLLGNLGALYPFTSASEILDQIEKIGIKATVGIIFPGPTTLSGSAVSFFGQKHTHYYPAHIIQIS